MSYANQLFHPRVFSEQQDAEHWWTYISMLLDLHKVDDLKVRKLILHNMFSECIAAQDWLSIQDASTWQQLQDSF